MRTRLIRVALELAERDLVDLVGVGLGAAAGAETGACGTCREGNNVSNPRPRTLRLSVVIGGFMPDCNFSEPPYRL